MSGSALNHRTVDEFGKAVGIIIDDVHLAEVTEVLQGELDSVDILDEFLWGFDHTEVEFASVFDAAWSLAEVMSPPRLEQEDI